MQKSAAIWQVSAHADSASCPLAFLPIVSANHHIFCRNDWPSLFCMGWNDYKVL